MNDYRNSKLDRRYNDDPAFRNVVGAMEQMISQHGFTPSELREALFLAHYKFEMENPDAINYRVALRMQQFWDVKTPKGEGE